MAKDLDIEIEDSGDELRVYELGFHLDPELPIEEVKKAYQETRGFISSKGAIIAEGEPEKIQLAYTISRNDAAGRRDFDSAYFSWIVYEAPTSSHSEIIAAASANTRMIRFIDLLTDKDAARHAVDMREISSKTHERTEDHEAVLGAELDAALDNVAV